MAYRAKNGKTYPYRESRSQYKQRKDYENTNLGYGCLLLIIFLWIFFKNGKEIKWEIEQV